MPLLARIFVVSYALAFALAVSQLFSRSPGRGMLLLFFTWAGFLLQTVFLFQRALTANGTPLSSPFDWNLLGAWALVAVCLYLAWYHPKTALELFLLPLALALIGLAHFADHEPFPHSMAGQVWGMIHGIFNLLGVVAVLVGFVAGMMYLIQSYRLKHKMPPAEELGLPSLEWLEHVNSRAIVISVLMVGAGFISGIILNVALRRRQLDELPWTDPVVWRSALLFGWLLAAAIFSAVYRPAQRPKGCLPHGGQLRLPGGAARRTAARAQRTRRDARKQSTIGNAQRHELPAACPGAPGLPAGEMHMKLQMVGCSHHNASLEVRERLAFSPEQTATALGLWRSRFPHTEAVLLSTCNRVEVYAASTDPVAVPSDQQVKQFLAEFHGLQLHQVFDDLFEQSGEGAVRHLFTVAASIDSMVLGEPQILAQVKQAYQLAQQQQSVGPITHEIFQRRPPRRQARGNRNLPQRAPRQHSQRRRLRFRPERVRAFRRQTDPRDRRRRNGRRNAGLPARRRRSANHRDRP